VPIVVLSGRKAGTDHGTVVAGDHSHGNSGRAHDAMRKSIAFVRAEETVRRLEYRTTRPRT
jgi:hypothetical protein